MRQISRQRISKKLRRKSHHGQRPSERGPRRRVSHGSRQTSVVAYRVLVRSRVECREQQCRKEKENVRRRRKKLRLQTRNSGALPVNVSVREARQLLLVYRVTGPWP